MKRIILFFVTVAAIHGATPEQVDRYLLISGSEDQLVEFEQMVDGMGQMFATKGTSGAPIMEDSQMISIRFKEFIQRNLSENEMKEVMDNYKHDVMRKLVSAQVLMEEAETVESYRQFTTHIKSEPLSASRTEKVKSIVKKMYDEKMLIDFFEKMFLPIMKEFNGMSGGKIDDKQLKSIEKRFIKRMKESNYNALLFMSRDFSDEELDELDELAGSSASNHETRTVYGAIVYAMEEAIKNISRRFSDMTKKRNRRHPSIRIHDRNSTAEGNQSAYVNTKENIAE